MYTFSAILGVCELNPSVTGGPRHKGPVVRSMDVFIVVSPNNLLGK